MVLICSKLQAAPFQGGFQVSRWVPYPLFANRSVVSWKNASSCGLNTIRRLVSYARGDIGPAFASAYRLPLPKDAPFAIGYTFEGKPHHYLPDAVGTLQSGRPFIAEAGMEDDKQGDRNLAKAEAARRLAHIQRGVFWLGTEHTLTRQRHTIWCSCMRGVGLFLPLLRSSWLC